MKFPWKYRVLCVLLALAAAMWSSSSGAVSAAIAPLGWSNPTLPSDGHDLVVDEARGVLYVSMPASDAVLSVDVATGAIVDQFAMAGSPRGIDLAADGDTLVVALNDTGEIALFDLTNETSQEIDVATELGHPTTWDVHALDADRYLVSANPGSGGSAWIVLVDTAQSTQTRVASNEIIRAGPVFIPSGPNHVLVGEGFSPNSLYKLDIVDPAAPIVDEDDHGDLGGTQSASAALDGSYIFTLGQIIDGDTLEQIATPPFIGLPVASPDGRVFFVSEDVGISVVDPDDWNEAQRITSGCGSILEPSRSVVNSTGTRLYTLNSNGQALCADDVTEPTSPDPQRAYPQPLDLATDTEITLVGRRLDVIASATVNDLPATFSGTDRRVVLTIPNGVTGPTVEVELTGTDASVVTVDMAVGRNGLVTDLGSFVADMVVSEARAEIYVSQPQLRRVTVVSSQTGALTNEYSLGGGPLGLDLSNVGDELFVAVDGVGGPAVIDLDTGVVELIPISEVLGDNRANDVVEAANGDLLVTAAGNGSTYVGRIDRTTEIASRVGDDQRLRSSPQLFALPDGDVIVISRTDGYRLDGSSPSYPISAQSTERVLSPLRVSSDGARLFGPVAVYRTSDFMEIGSFEGSEFESPAPFPDGAGFAQVWWWQAQPRLGNGLADGDALALGCMPRIDPISAPIGHFSPDRSTLTIVADGRLCRISYDDDAPLARDDEFEILSGQEVVLRPLDNDIDQGSGLDPASAVLVSEFSAGDNTFAADGTLPYIGGNDTSFDYRVCSTGGICSIATITITTIPGADVGRPLAVGAPGEDIGSVADAGSVTLLMERGDGVLLTDGATSFRQGDGIVGGRPEPGDGFGQAVAVGDFDGNGFFDIAVGVPNEDLGTVVDAGMVQVIRRGPFGIVGTKAFHQGTPGVRGGVEAGDGFATSLAVADFNDDGFDDLAVGVPFEDLGAAADAGGVQVFFGSSSGLQFSDDLWLDQSRPGIAGVNETGDQFGLVLDAADRQLVIGSPFEDLGSKEDAGNVQVVEFGGDNWTLNQDSPGVPGVAEADDRFGASIDVQFGLIAAGAPGEDIGTIRDAGSATLAWGPSGVRETVSQSSPGISGGAETGDGFGSALHLTSGFGVIQLRVGVPDEDVGSRRDAGLVHILRWDYGLNTLIDNGTVTGASPQVQGSAETGDRFGASITSRRFLSVIAVPGESLGSDADAGMILGVTGSGSVAFHQGTPGIPGRVEAGDLFGSAID